MTIESTNVNPLHPEKGKKNEFFCAVEVLG